MRFGSEIEQDKINLLFIEYCDKNALFRKMVPNKKRFYADIIRQIKAFGTTHEPADSYAFRSVKRNSLIRQLQAAKYPVAEWLKDKNINELTAEDILRYGQKNLGTLGETSSLSGSEDFGRNLVDVAKNFLAAPEYGIQTPFEFINYHMHGLYKNDVTMLGGVSNSGKGRCLINLLAHLVCVENQKVYLMSNEMTTADYYKVLLCTIVNSPQIQKLHGKTLSIPQADIVQSRFHDRSGCVIERMPDESTSEFESRLLEQSQEYHDYSSVVQWFQDNYADKLHVVNVSNDYSIGRLKAEIRKAENMGCSVVAYDTLKAHLSAEWTDLYITATELAECIKSSRSGLHGIFTFQLTDEVNYLSPEKLGTNNIAHAKNIINVADNMIMFQQLSPEKNKYYYLDMCDFDASLPSNKKFAIFKIVKNRRGGGKGIMYAVQNDLNINCWKYIAEVYPVSQKRSDSA